MRIVEVTVDTWWCRPRARVLDQSVETANDDTCRQGFVRSFPWWRRSFDIHSYRQFLKPTSPVYHDVRGLRRRVPGSRSRSGEVVRLLLICGCRLFERKRGPAWSTTALCLFRCWSCEVIRLLLSEKLTRSPSPKARSSSMLTADTFFRGLRVQDALEFPMPLRCK